ncbi:hypothetical protein ACFX1X_022103 [Malus domestica]
MELFIELLGAKVALKAQDSWVLERLNEKAKSALLQALCTSAFRGTVWYADGTGRDGTERNGMELLHRPPCIVVIVLRATSNFFPPTHQTVSLSLSPTSLSKSGDFVLIPGIAHLLANHLDQDHNPLPGTAHLLATSDDELSFESGCVPDQIHLAYTDGDYEIRVMFVTPDGAGEKEGLLW